LGDNVLGQSLFRSTGLLSTLLAFLRATKAANLMSMGFVKIGSFILKIFNVNNFNVNSLKTTPNRYYILLGVIQLKGL
jgi:hypothetical protein